MQSQFTDKARTALQLAETFCQENEAGIMWEQSISCWDFWRRVRERRQECLWKTAQMNRS